MRFYPRVRFLAEETRLCSKSGRNNVLHSLWRCGGIEYPLTTACINKLGVYVGVLGAYEGVLQ